MGLKNFIHDADDAIIDVGDLCMLVDESKALSGKVVAIKIVVVVEENGCQYEFDPKEIRVMPF